MRRRATIRDPAGERGSVTAELAVALPAVLAAFALAAAGIAVAGRMVLLTDAASVAARSVSRGDAVTLPDSAPPGTQVDLFTSGGITCATASAATAIGPIAMPISARSCALGTAP